MTLERCTHRAVAKAVAAVHTDAMTHQTILTSDVRPWNAAKAARNADGIRTSRNHDPRHSFLGSGTTVAVAHRMRRHWIGVAMGDHAETHGAARLRKVIDGKQGSISEAPGRTGGEGDDLRLATFKDGQERQQMA